MRFKYILPILLTASLGGLLCGCDRAGTDGPITDPTTPHTHAAAAWETVTLPTCTEEGYAVGSCVTCGEDMEMTLPTLAHSYAEPPTVIPPTCTEAGYTLHTCACGHTYRSDETSPVGHTYQETVTAPTCEAAGYTTYTCSCGFSYDGNYIPSTDHTYSETVTPPTCEEKGYTTYTCDCGFFYHGDFTPSTGHTYTETVTPPTCEEEGFTTYTCDCGFTYTGNKVTPLGHSFDETVIPPTCTEAGYTHYLCVACGHEQEGDPTPPTAHANSTSRRFYPTVDRDGYTLHSCPDCGQTYEDGYISYHEIYAGAYVDGTEIFMQGIDTSKWNHDYGVSLEDVKPLDWATLKAAGVDFVILKAGSTLGIDPAFELDYRDAKAAGLQVGAYFYAYSTTVEDTLADAELLLSWLEGKQFELPIYIDMEETSMMALGGAHLTELCRAFVNRLQEEGYYAALYTNTEWLYNLLDTEWVKANLDIWYARYTTALPEGQEHFALDDRDFAWKDGTAYKPGETDRRFGLWQYTDNGGVEGFRYPFDFNFAFKDYKPIMEKWGLNGFPSVV